MMELTRYSIEWRLGEPLTRHKIYRMAENGNKWRQKGNFDAALAKEHAATVYLDKNLAKNHCNGFCSMRTAIKKNAQPLTDISRYYPKTSPALPSVERVANVDPIWVYDYHLVLLPQSLRKRLQVQNKRCLIGFSLHSSFLFDDFWRGLTNVKLRTLLTKSKIVKIRCCNSFLQVMLQTGKSFNNQRPVNRLANVYDFRAIQEQPNFAIYHSLQKKENISTSPVISSMLLVQATFSSGQQRTRQPLPPSSML
ncbi:tspB [Penicillium lividum]|nr:tspB [Penicillium lividum]